MTRKTMARVMIALTILIAIAASIVCYMAVERGQYLIAILMLIVTIGQAVNFFLWRKKSR